MTYDDSLARAIVPGGAFLTVEELQAANEAAGRYWFSRATMRHGSRSMSLYGGRFLLAKERAYDDAPVWHVGYALADGTIDYLPAADDEVWASLTLDTERAGQVACRHFEAGRPPIDRLDYDKQVACLTYLKLQEAAEGRPVPSCGYASWLVAGFAYCSTHAGSAIRQGLVRATVADSGQVGTQGSLLQPRPDPSQPRTTTGASHPDTSHEAARRALPRSGTQRERVLAYYRANYPVAFTREFVADQLQIPYGSINARCNELVNDGWLVDTGLREPTKAGSPAMMLQYVVGPGGE
jgi:hypothetical protein